MNITCIGHSGFLVETPKLNLIFDYYTDKTGVISPKTFANQKTLVFASHKHYDHYNKEIFDWIKHGNITYILDEGCNAPTDKNITKMQEGETINIGEVSITAFGSTDEGLSFLVDTGSEVLFHAGDLNDWYWEDESTPEELLEYEESYLRIIKQLAGRHIDVAFIPEDPRLGKHSGRGIFHFKKIVAPGRIIPMHFPGNDGKEYSFR